MALSRAVGETMIVAMAAGLNANLTANPLENVTTVTVQIVVALIGDQNLMIQNPVGICFGVGPVFRHLDFERDRSQHRRGTGKNMRAIRWQDRTLFLKGRYSAEKRFNCMGFCRILVWVQ